MAAQCSCRSWCWWWCVVFVFDGDFVVLVVLLLLLIEWVAAAAGTSCGVFCSVLFCATLCHVQYSSVSVQTHSALFCWLLLNNNINVKPEHQSPRITKTVHTVSMLQCAQCQPKCAPLTLLLLLLSLLSLALWWPRETLVIVMPLFGFEWHPATATHYYHIPKRWL